MSPNVNDVNPADDDTTPTMSGDCDRETWDFGMKAATAANPTITSGTLIKKVHPPHACESSQPPTIGPRGIPIAVDVTQMLSARARSALSGKIDGSTGIGSGIII